MNDKKLHRHLEKALEDTAPELWGTSNTVSYALLNCPRVKGMVVNLMRKQNILHDYFSEIISDVAITTQCKYLVHGLGEKKGQLQSISEIYFLVYKIIQFIVLNYGRLTNKTRFPREINLSSLKFADETDEEVLTLALNNPTIEDFEAQVTANIDNQKARQHFEEKLKQCGWPTQIPKTRKRVGRPSKTSA